MLADHFLSRKESRFRDQDWLVYCKGPQRFQHHVGSWDADATWRLRPPAAASCSSVTATLLRLKLCLSDGP